MQACSLTFYRTYRAPAHHGEALIEPQVGYAAELIARNRSTSSSWGIDFAGKSLTDLRLVARTELVRDALAYSRKYRDVIEPLANHPIVMSGHQPSLFHPGVWFKNFALDRVSRQTLSGGVSPTAINLVIDNDVASSSNVRVPVVDAKTGLLRQESVLFDSASGGVPYEQNRIRNRGVFQSFDRRIRDAIKPIVPDPLVTRLWRHALDAVARCENVSCAVAHARHALEGELGLQTLELPLSVVCRSESFSAFALSIISDLNRFREIYNSELKRYRFDHGIRSSAHPVPELGVRDDWVEAPFWIYGDDSPQRKAAWVRRSGGMIEISDLVHRKVTLSLNSGATEELASLASANWKLRPRALVTTMYARMILSDLFIHGIGGAKYDQLGDQIVKRFFGVTAAEMMVVSATVMLPSFGISNSTESVQSIRQRIRDTRFAPETFSDSVDLSVSLLARKKQLLAGVPSSGSRLAWYHEMKAVNQVLATQLIDERVHLESQLQIAKQEAASMTILGSREHSFCLFNLEELNSIFDGMLS